MADANGPPSSSKAPEILATTTTKMNDGLTALRNDQFEEAVEQFNEALQTRIAHFGELALETALPFYYYGVALLDLAQSTRDVFAEDPETGDQEMDEDDENPSELKLAWQALECARRVYEDQSTPHDSALASVHVVLGDVALESSNLALAFKEFTNAISYLEKVTNEDQATQEGVKSETRSVERRFSEVYYKTALACEFLDDLTQAAEYSDKAIHCIQQEINSQEGKEEDVIKELKDIEKDLLEHREGIEIASKQREEVKEMLRQMFETQASKTEEKAENEKEVIDLGVFGRRKHRFATEEDEKNTEKETTTNTLTQTPTKRKEESSHDESDSVSKRKKVEDDNLTYETKPRN